MSTRYKPGIQKSKHLDNLAINTSDRCASSNPSSTSSKAQHHYEERYGKISPFLQRQLSGLSSSRPILCKEKSLINSNSIRVILFLIKIYTQRLLLAFRSVEKTFSPIALTQCPRCDHVGLSLLTTSTKQQLSPTFHSKILRILPNSQLNPTKPSLNDSRKYQNPTNHKENLLNSNKNTLNQRELELGKNLSKENYSKTKIFTVLKENNSDKVPKLNISGSKAIKKRTQLTKGISMLSSLFYASMLSTFQELSDYEPSTYIESSNLDFSRGLERKYTFGYVENPELFEYGTKEPKNSKLFEESFFIEYPSPSLAQRTAFKILYSRIKKIIFRRKLHIFANISNNLT